MLRPCNRATIYSLRLRCQVNFLSSSSTREKLGLLRCGRRTAGSAAKILVMPAKKELVGHAGDVIANDDVARFRLRKLLMGSRHRTVVAEVVDEKFLQTLHGAVAVLGDGGMLVDMRE